MPEQSLLQKELQNQIFSSAVHLQAENKQRRGEAERFRTRHHFPKKYSQDRWQKRVRQRSG